MRPSLLAPLQHLPPLIRPYRRHVAAFLVLGVLATLVEGVGIGLLIPLLQGQTAPTQQASPVLHWFEQLAALLPDGHRTLALTGLILGVMLIKAVLAFGFTALLHWIASRAREDARQAMAGQVLKLSQSYLDSRPGASLLHTLTTGPVEVSTAITALLWLILNTGTVLIFAMLLAVVAWPLTLAAIVLLLTVAGLVRLATRKAGRIGKSNLRYEKELTHLARELLSGIRMVRIFGREAYEARRIRAASEQAHGYRMQGELLVSLTHPLSELLGAALVVGMVALALQAGFELSVLVAMTFMVYRLQPQLVSANGNLATLSQHQAAVRAVLELMEESGKPYPVSGGRRPGPLADGIRLEGVGFSYDGQQQALNDIDCCITRHQATALVGRSGSGKTTLVNLLCRFYEPSEGRILVDGVPMDELDLAAWRGRIALVSQDVHLFNATVRENILYGRPAADRAEWLQAARRAHAHDFISALPQGYDTVVGERGLKLSGGQRQRLSIARAFLRDPEILILDEATNALDNLSEAHIQAAIADLSQGRTLLVIAHRLSTIEQAERILVLDRGRLVEQGVFAELMAAEGSFAELYRGQQKGQA